MSTIHAVEVRQKKEKRSKCRGSSRWSVATKLRESRYPTETANASETRFPSSLNNNRPLNVRNTVVSRLREISNENYKLTKLQNYNLGFVPLWYRVAHWKTEGFEKENFLQGHYGICAELGIYCFVEVCPIKLRIFEHFGHWTFVADVLRCKVSKFVGDRKEGIFFGDCKCVEIELRILVRSDSISEKFADQMVIYLLPNILGFSFCAVENVK
ncbi:hypothetical protein WN51_05188 [Melipona quadrifasciata]|uniref:Uncharacterized protein n=1 Tax=Melipona quadrifasciata TaxID=166423 RepID=A0A0M8ZU30_9HYME|nr:hypothetical protein WN51_05188 [Melipona quadrifasciata]